MMRVAIAGRVSRRNTRITAGRLAGIVGLGGAVVAGGALLGMRARAQSTVERVRGRLMAAGAGRRGSFEERMVADLPGPARRYLSHAIRPGAELARTVNLEMDGTLRLAPGRPWLPVQAREILVPPEGFVWEATAGRGAFRFSGADYYADGVGETRFRLWDLVPIARASGPDVSRSARGRLALETIWHPAALLPQRGVTWEPIDDRSARATLVVDGEPTQLTLAIRPDGSLRAVTADRWGNIASEGSFQLIPFGADMLEEAVFGGYTIPSRVRCSWWYGTEQQYEFFDAVVRRAAFS